MKILTITNMFPNKKSPYYGIFVKEQMEALNNNYPNVQNSVYFINGKKNIWNYLWSIFSINWLITFRKYDIIHVHYTLSGLFLLINPFIKTPVIITLHGSDFHSKNNLLQKIYKNILARANALICLNKKMVSELKEINPNLYLIPCGVNTNIFKPEKRKKTEQEYTIVFPSSHKREVKNYPFFKAVIDELCREYNLTIKIIEIENKTRAEVNTIFNSSDLVCLTSFSEGSPQVIKEAMCTNTPIISSDVGDVRNVLNNVDNCLVIEGYELKDYVFAIKSLLDIPTEERISNGREKIFNLELDSIKTSEKIINLYNNEIIKNEKT